MTPRAEAILTFAREFSREATSQKGLRSILKAADQLSLTADETCDLLASNDYTRDDGNRTCYWAPLQSILDKWLAKKTGEQTP